MSNGPMLSTKHIRHRLFGAYYREDMCDRYGASHPRLVRSLYWRFHRGIADRRVIFIHVPRAAGTSVSQTLHDGEPVGHHSIRAWKALEPDFVAVTPSFALIRNPYQRFASSYRFVRAGGASEVGLNGTFRRMTAHIDSIDAYLAFLEDKSPLDLDFVMRPQSWFVSDLDTGCLLVDRIFRLDDERAAIDAFLLDHGAGPLPHSNRSSGERLDLTPQQRRRVEDIYAADFTLWDA
jgi:hypothetical protein